MSQTQSPELELVALVKQRDAITSQINSLLQRIVGGTFETAATPAARPGRPAGKKKPGRRGRPAGSKNVVNATSAAPKKRGRPVGWRKNPAAATSSTSANPAAPKKRGRPVGWRKNPAAATTNASVAGPAKKKAGHPAKSAKK